MTDQSVPAPASPDAAPYEAPQSPAPPPPSDPPVWGPGAAKQPGKWRPVIIIGAIVVFMAVVLFAVRNNAAANDLTVGDCFNIPEGTSIQTVEKRSCTESHNGEVVFVGEYNGDSYPISLSLDRYLQDSCVPAFETFVGRAFDSEPELSIGYFYPSRDSWDNGDRTVTCYISQPDESPMTESLKG